MLVSSEVLLCSLAFLCLLRAVDRCDGLRFSITQQQLLFFMEGILKLQVEDISSPESTAYVQADSLSRTSSSLAKTCRIALPT